MAEHAVLSPSSAERWLACPASVRLSIGVKDESSVYADEGTNAHTRAEMIAARRFGLIDEAEYLRRQKRWRSIVTDPDARLEMSDHADDYADLIGEALARHPHSSLLLEQRVYTGVHGCWGTADAVIVSPRHVHVIDYKYGKGVEVCAEDNPQLKLYGVGALDTFGDVLGDTEFVEWTIHQPRLGTTSTDSTTVADLRRWRDHAVAPVAAEALAGSDRFGPSLTSCRWCPVAGTCRPRIETLARLDFGHPELMSANELAELIPRLPEIRDMASAVEAAALQRVYADGETIPGWKVVRSGGRRKIVDDEEAIDRLIRAGFTREQVERRSARTLGDLERLVGKAELPGVLGSTLERSEGKPALAPEDDDRPAISPASAAAEMFGPPQ